MCLIYTTAQNNCLHIPGDLNGLQTKFKVIKSIYIFDKRDKNAIFEYIIKL